MALVATASLLLVTACGSTGASSGDAAPLSSIKITPGSDDTSDPTVTFDTPLVATETAAQVIVKGKGDDIKENQNIKFKSIAYNAEDGAIAGSGFAGEPVTLPTNEEFKTQLPALYETLMQAKVGSWVAMVEPAAEAAATTEEGASPSAEEGTPQAKTVVVLKVVSTEEIPPAAEPSKKLGDDEVKKLKDEGALPTVEMKDDKPSITIPKDKEAPAGLVVDVVKEGTGKVATATSKVSANYTGVRWEDGKQFDSSYDRGEASDFGLDGVIAGWTQGLTGLKAGTQVMLTIPGDLAYGLDEASAQGRPAGTLVFFVELKEVK
ncbi:FKBP-type 22 kDa peptidyl-prolyl cis-trans isomerase [Paeniglutamicibacter gangotriensis Lz1y]|uniref:Peptidyl-prolyl cis-trans isomerase n=2 Tax=Paeniglutamicibacter gangotriensis TaxID=254787 RepID=M7N4E1_9MICC|nr:FKBP-type 22 kDa peptidyl-prolyl cis-trans isomerase [Paeniglutamicibacter gangotriensis Lz1y]